MRKHLNEMHDTYHQARLAQQSGDQEEFQRLSERSIQSASAALTLGGARLPYGLRERLETHAAQLETLAKLSGWQTAAPAMSAAYRSSPATGPSAPRKPPATLQSTAQAREMTLPPSFTVDASALLEAVALDSFFPIADETPPKVATPKAQGPSLYEIRRALAQTFMQDPLTPVRDKMKLDDAAMVRAMGTVQVRHGHRSERRPFRVSFISSPTNNGDFLVGSSLSSGGYAKVRPTLVLGPEGQRLEAAIKELRTQPVNQIAADGTAKDALNRHGRSRNMAVGNVDLAFNEWVEMKRLAEPFMEVHVITAVDDKLYLVTEYMDGGDMTQLSRDLEPSMRTAFARLALSDLVKHYQHIAAEGFVHADGKLENALISYRGGKVVASDFGETPQLGADGLVSKPANVTFVSPEIAQSSSRRVACTGFGTAHDVWTLGISALRLLAGDAVEVTNLIYPAHLVRLRQELFPNYALGDDTMLPLRDVRSRKSGDAKLWAAIERMMVRDLSLAQFVLWRMLEPDPARRASLEECADMLELLKKPYLGEKDDLFDRLSRIHGSGEQAFRKLHIAADMLLGETRA